MNPLRACPSEEEEPPSQRPTEPPPSALPGRHHSGVRRKGEDDEWCPAARAGRRGRIDVRWVPLLINRGPLLTDPPRLITSMLIASMNGVLSVEDLSEVTGIPLGAVADGLLDLERRGVILLDRSAGWPGR